MRLTVLDDDHDRKIHIGTERYRVFVDGVQVRHVFTADDDNGKVVCAVLNERGHMYAESGEVTRQTLRGEV